uniref:PsbM n=1 Tax=Abies durangensis TaxID=425839 RepID=A0A451EII4_9CONI|nr:PsbM [Abies durangensis]
MEVNNQAFLGVALFISIPTASLIIPYVKTVSGSSVSSESN